MNSLLPRTRQQRGRAVFHSMVSRLRRQILAGELTPGSRLPTEPELGETFGISVSSVRRGIDLLVADGVVERRQGSGMYVQNASLDRQPNALNAAGTVALVAPLQLPHYHPFFSEQLRGLRERLLHLGYAYQDISPIRDPDPTIPPTDLARAWDLDVDQVAARLSAMTDLTAMVVSGTGAKAIQALAPQAVPTVALDEAEGTPYICYDWPFEQARALRALHGRGARHVWGLRTFTPDPTCVPPGLDLRLDSFENRPAFTSQLVHESYIRCFDALRRDPSLGAVLAGDDFISQGCLDAVAQIQQETGRQIQIACMRSAATQLRTALRPIHVICDGHEKGVALADLLHAHLNNLPDAAQVITLACRLQT